MTVVTVGSEMRCAPSSREDASPARGRFSTALEVPHGEAGVVSRMAIDLAHGKRFPCILDMPRSNAETGAGIV